MHHERLRIIWTIVGKTMTINAPLTVSFFNGGGGSGGAPLVGRSGGGPRGQVSHEALLRA